MTVAYGLEWLRNLMWTAVLAAGPAVLAVSVVGLLIAVVQAATQVNDQAVAFGPKAIALILSIVVGGSWMFGELTHFTVSVFAAMSRIAP